jgi:hypothetical protein
MRARTLVILAACAVLGATCWIGGSATAAPGQAGGGCPVTGAGPYVSCVRAPSTSKPNVGLQITDGSGPDPGIPFMITDHLKAPLLSDSRTGLDSYGDGGAETGGSICVTYGVEATIACLTPEGNITLTPTGPHGPTGPAQTFTPRDIRFIHRLERTTR